MEGQHAPFIAVVAVELIGAGNPYVPDAGGAVICVDQHLSVSGIGVVQLIVAGFPPSTVRQSRSVVPGVDHSVQEPAGMDKIGDLDAHLHASPQTIAVCQVQPPNLSVLYDSFPGGVFDDIVAGNIDDCPEQ